MFSPEGQRSALVQRTDNDPLNTDEISPSTLLPQPLSPVLALRPKCCLVIFTSIKLGCIMLSLHKVWFHALTG
jgi:hypothetical protein